MKSLPSPFRISLKIYKFLQDVSKKEKKRKKIYPIFIDKIYKSYVNKTMFSVNNNDTKKVSSKSLLLILNMYCSLECY